MPRKRVKNKDGTTSTERSITVTDKRLRSGLPTNIPSMFKGRQVSQENAIQKIVRNKGKDPETNRTVKSFMTIGEAVKAASKRSKSLGRKK